VRHPDLLAVVWPRAGDPAAPLHGFARVNPWQMRTSRSQATMPWWSRCVSKPRRQPPLWPHRFALRYTLKVARTLSLSLEVRNTGAEPFQFEEALHSYLAVGDVRAASVTGWPARSSWTRPMASDANGRRASRCGSPPRRIGCISTRVPPVSWTILLRAAPHGQQERLGHDRGVESVDCEGEGARGFRRRGMAADALHRDGEHGENAVTLAPGRRTRRGDACGGLSGRIEPIAGSTCRKRR